MKTTSQKRSVWFYALIGSLILLGLGGIGGGVAMLLDPSGAGMGLPLELLEGLPISNFILPGLFLISVMGIAPLGITCGLWKDLPWAWTAAVVQGIVLLLWICLQILLWGAPEGIQILYLIWGIVIVALCFLPGVKSR